MSAGRVSQRDPHLQEGRGRGRGRQGETRSTAKAPRRAQRTPRGSGAGMALQSGPELS